MMFWKRQNRDYRIYIVLSFIVLAQFALVASAQNLGGQPAFDKAVQGQTAAQPKALS